ncbi:hypothetical protein F511_42588 [Dorcoceras hygrometricum]|uniref:Uncharacterized protein n=1 Tax=Dorcoceras hygrometricum TaxID=472368 RepID=A0A2Z6ZZ58_9LAMI|nr:hypothetical protein F511_42588 [Dorcoceras hygrometricum]
MPLKRNRAQDIKEEHNPVPVARRSQAPRRGGICSSAEVIWLHQLVPSVGSVEERQDATQEE